MTQAMEFLVTRTRGGMYVARVRWNPGDGETCMRFRMGRIDALFAVMAGVCARAMGINGSDLAGDEGI